MALRRLHVAEPRVVPVGSGPVLAWAHSDSPAPSSSSAGPTKARSRCSTVPSSVTARILLPVVDDTHPRVQAKVNEIFAAMSPGERFAAMAAMTDFVCDQSMAAIAATMPNAPPMEVALRWSEIHYGLDLTTLLRRHLVAQR